LGLRAISKTTAIITRLPIQNVIVPEEEVAQSIQETISRRERKFQHYTPSKAGGLMSVTASKA